MTPFYLGLAGAFLGSTLFEITKWLTNLWLNNPERAFAKMQADYRRSLRSKSRAKRGIESSELT